MRARRTARHGAVLVAIAACAVVLSMLPASARRDATLQADGEGETRLSLVEQSAWVGPEGTFDLRLRVENAPPGAKLALAVYRADGSRTAFANSINGEDLGSPLRPLPPVIPIDFLPRAADGSVVLSFPVTTETPGPLGVRVDGQGVFPVLVSVLDADDDELDRLTTHLVRLPDPGDAGRPLAFTLIVPFASGPSFAPDGRPQVAPETATRAGAAANALVRNPTVPLTLDPVPETVEALYSSGDAGNRLVTSLRGALGDRQVLADTYVPLDLGSWVASPDPSVPDELGFQTTTGADVLGALLGVRPDRRSTVVDRSVTREALTWLSEVGVDQLVVPEDQLGPLSGQAAQVTFTQRFEVLNSDGRAMRAVTTDAALADRLTATEDPVLNAHLVLADLAVLYFDRPNVARGAVLAVPPELAVPEATYHALLTGLSETSQAAGRDAGGVPVVAPMTLDDLFDATSVATGPRGDALVRSYEADDPIPLGSLPESIQATRSRIGSFTEMVREGAGVARIPALDRQVLIAEAAGLDGDTRQAYLDGVSAEIDAQLANVVTTESQQVTLTDRSGDIPLTIENRLDYPVTVSVILTSAKLEFPNGNTQTVTLPPATPTQVGVAVSTKASGAFPLDVRVQSPDGALLVGSTRYTVRSTAVSGVGLLISIGAGAFLLVWWARHWRGVRRARRLVSTAAHPSMRGASDGGPSPAPTLK
jgi:hypothetical protein